MNLCLTVSTWEHRERWELIRQSKCRRLLPDLLFSGKKNPPECALLRGVAGKFKGIDFLRDHLISISPFSIFAN